MLAKRLTLLALSSIWLVAGEYMAFAWTGSIPGRWHSGSGR